jgi:uncharacterized protein YjbI with pentapeptide repeats
MVGTVALNLRTWVAPETVRPQQFEGDCIDARGANWSEQDLGEQDLRNANLCRCDLRGSNLSRCQLEGADLRLARFDTATTVPNGFDLFTSGAVGPGAKLNGAFLNNADLRGIDLRGAVLMGAYLSGADLSGALLDGVSLAGSDLRFATLRGAMCRATRFGTSQLDLADFRGADLQDAALDSVESIKGADFSHCSGLNEQLTTLLNRSAMELDHWNPLTRGTTRISLESLRSPQS